VKKHRFSLKPFRSSFLSPPFEITGTLWRHLNELEIIYELSGPLSELVLQAPSAAPLRMGGLWKETCFEFFLSPKDAEHYWEFNISPAGHWNVYRFASYRQEMKEELAIESLSSSTHVHSRALQISVKLLLDRIVKPDGMLIAGLSAVVKTINQGVTHWALVLTGPKADFHRRDNFIIEL
jgi:hypothetical protein